MDGYDDSTYGEAFADVYDDWYTGLTDIDLAVTDLLALTDGGAILELGVGTGRLAMPLAVAGAERDVSVTGVDISPAMLARLAERDPERLVSVVTGDMVDDLPPGPFALAVATYNTFFNLGSEQRQAACFRAVGERLVPRGRFVIESFVPDDPPRDGTDVSVRSLTSDRVVLAATVHDAGRQTAEGQFIEITESGGVRLRPWSIRYATPAQLDALANDAGFELEHRWEAFGGAEFDDDSPRHVTVFRKI